MKTIFLTTIIFLLSLSLYSQDQTIKGVLTVKDNLIIQTGDSLRTPFGKEGSCLYFGRMAQDNSDYVYMARFNRETNKSDLRINIGDDDGGDDRFVVGNHVWRTSDVFTERFVVTNQSRVGIGVSHPTCALDVNGAIKSNQLDVAGTIRAREVKIEITAGADYVFSTDYNLRSLSEVETFVQENKHLPDIPSEKQMQEEGLNVNEMQIKLLQKIEELTLYVIEQDKQIKELKKQLKDQ